MEWYFGCGVDDLVFSKDQEFSDRSPSSPGILSKWGTNTPEIFLSPNSYFSMDTNSVDEDFNFNGFCNEVDIEASIQDKCYSSGSSTCAGSLEEFLQRTALSSNRPDYQVDHFEGIEQLDDIFLNSLLEDLPMTEDLHSLLGFDPKSQFVLPAKGNSSDTHTRGCSKYLKTHAFSTSVGWEHEEDVASPFNPCKSEAKVSLAKLQVPSEQNIANELVDEETSSEESVLQELKTVMTQMTCKTRICVRDALFRLAENSKQHVATSRQNGNGRAETPPELGHDISMRFGKKKAMESKTNICDRAIANLLYKTELNIRDFSAVASVNPEQEVMEETGSPIYIFNQPPMNHFCHDMLAGDAEVPTFGQKPLAAATKKGKDFSKEAAETSVIAASSF